MFTPILNWHNIRPIDNSLNNGFEELVCQLAAKEPIANQKYFQRIGKPDAGKECYWELVNGGLHMWQAKYFTESLSSKQWTQIDDSVKKAIDNHPLLIKYYVCLPLDMPDAKVKGKKSMLDKWKEKVIEWEKYALSRGVAAEFEYWGSTQLISRLSKKDNEGLAYFWFNKEEFTDDWLSAKNRESIDALGPRYTKELNIDLPIARIFDGISRDENFERQIHKLYNFFLEKYRRVHINIEHEGIKQSLLVLATAINEFKTLYKSAFFISNDPILVKQLKEITGNCLAVIDRIHDFLYELRKQAEKDKGVTNYYSRPYSSEISRINEFDRSVYDFEKFLDSPTCKLANRPILMLTGNAGTGKSHLLADIVGRRKNRNQNSLLLLGENFTNSDMPWTQILQNQLRKNQLDEFIFLGALNAKAESERSRIVIFIDAINEGNGRKIWPKRLKSFINSFEKYPWLALVISVRTSFEELIAPKKEIGEDIISRVSHRGFEGVEYAATKRFFDYYRIIQPSSPLLNPEFQNPLFLKLFCKSISDRGLHEIPPGFEGITAIVDSFLESINLKLARPEELDYDDKLPLVKMLVEELLLKMVEKGKDHVKYIEADKIANSVFREACNNSEPFLKRLISEGVLNDDLFWDDSGTHYDVVYFAYQRFQDHLTVSLLLDKYLDKKQPELSFKKGKLHDLIKDDYATHVNQNLVDALAIQVPERTGKELFEVAPHTKLYYSVAEAFVQSLTWRKHDTIGNSAKDYVNEVIVHDDSLNDYFIGVCILSSMKPGFYFNAERLHIYLSNFSLSERDAQWTVWLQDKYDDDKSNSNSVKRLIDFAWNIETEQAQINDESLLLGCITLGWFLTSANRYLRDAATKGLVCLLQHRIHLIQPLLKKFENVNDFYVIERLYAAAYGSVLRAKKTDALITLTEYIYRTMFNHKEVVPHILLRDYARGIIEYTIYLKYKPKIDIKKVRPPYKSKKLPTRLPSINTIDKKHKPKKDSGNYGKNNWGSTAILDSMTTEYGRGTARYGDFGRYTFQRAFSDWNINYDRLSNHAVDLIFKLGYDPALFSEFDSRQGSGRSSGHKERIGKKYQWIVFYQLLARVSDYFKLIDESSLGRRKKTIAYDGPWYPYIRDIDPTTLIKETYAERYVDEYSAQWWFHYKYAPWNMQHTDWISNRADLPLPENILEVCDENGEQWLWLEIHPEWGEKEPLGEDRWDSKRKRLWYQMRSYLVQKDDILKLKRFLQRNFHRGELPEARSMYTIFDKEYYWSPAFNFFNKINYRGGSWVELTDKSNKVIAKVHRTAEYYNWEEEYDCSKKSAIQYYKPVQLLQQALNLTFSKQEGELINDAGKLICFDPSVNNRGISGLLIRKKELLAWLEKENLVLVWSVVGEKQFLGNYRIVSGERSRLNVSGFYILNDVKINGQLYFKEE